MPTNLPAQMKAVLLPAPDQKLEVKQMDIPECENNEVVVKMHASPINPSDLAFLTGKYTAIPEFPVVPGIEGSGTVVKTGKHLLARRLLGKNVICSPSGKGGTWAEYMVTGAMKCIPINKNVDLDHAATMIVNPLSALALIGFVKDNGHKGVVINAANSNLGKMMIRLCQKENLACVAIVRKQDQVAELKQLGAKDVLISTQNNFLETLKITLQKHQVSCALDAISGPMSNLLLTALPAGGALKIYGRLAGEMPVIDPKELIQNNKTISGFYLGGYLQQLGLLKKMRLIGRAKKMAGAELKSSVASSIKFEEVNEAIQQYNLNMSGGKVLLKP